jgi:D-alanine-D-alanine ligase-like ATP-grasp enzyme
LIKKKAGLPCFVKPANSGSSIGVSKVKNISQLNQAIKLKAKYVNGKSVAIAPVTLNKKIIQQIQKLALRAYRALNCMSNGTY